MTTTLTTIPLDDFSNSNATTSWVNRVIEYSQRPRCVGNGGLNVRISKGRIRKEGCTKDILNDTSYIPTYIYTNGAINISVIANTIEYAWLRYSDKQIVVSEGQPTTTQGDLIAIIYTGAKSVTKIENYDGWNCPPSSVVYCCPDEDSSSNVNLAGNDKSINVEDVEGLAYIIMSQNSPNRNPRNPSELWLQVRGNYRAIWWAIPTSNTLTWMNVCSSVAIGVHSPNTNNWVNENISSDIWGQLYFCETTGKLWINSYGSWRTISA